MDLEKTTALQNKIKQKKKRRNYVKINTKITENKNQTNEQLKQNYNDMCQIIETTYNCKNCAFMIATGKAIIENELEVFIKQNQATNIVNNENSRIARCEICYEGVGILNMNQIIVLFREKILQVNQSK